MAGFLRVLGQLGETIFSCMMPTVPWVGASPSRFGLPRGTTCTLLGNFNNWPSTAPLAMVPSAALDSRLRRPPKFFSRFARFIYNLSILKSIYVLTSESSAFFKLNLANYHKGRRARGHRSRSSRSAAIQGGILRQACARTKVINTTYITIWYAQIGGRAYLGAGLGSLIG